MKKTALILSVFSLVFAHPKAMTEPVQSEAMTQAEEEKECNIMFTDEPPFWVTDADSSMGARNYDNFKGLKTKNGALVNSQTISKNNVAYIPRRAIVRLLTGEDIIEKYKKNEYLPVEVVSLPPLEEDENLKKVFYSSHYGASQLSARRSGLDRVKVGQKGYVFGGKIKKITETITVKGENNNDIETDVTYTQRLDSSVIAPSNLKLTPKKKDMLFTVTNNTAFITPTMKDGDLDNRPMRLATGKNEKDKGKYKVRNCDGKLHYFFEVLSSDLSEVEKEFYFDPACDELKDLLPIPAEQFVDINNLRKALNESSDKEEREPLNLNDMNLWAEKGFVKIPLGEVKYVQYKDMENQLHDYGNLYAHGPYGSVHYVSSTLMVSDELTKQNEQDGRYRRAKRELASDNYMRPKTACSFLSALKNFTEVQCPTCGPVQWGDAYWPAGERGGERHGSHGGGHCIDFRPPRDDNTLGSYLLRSEELKKEDMKKTRLFMESLKQAGATDIIFNPLAAKRRGGVEGVRSFKRHGTHIHVCFNPKHKPLIETKGRANQQIKEGENSQMKKTCNQLNQ